MDKEVVHEIEQHFMPANIADGIWKSVVTGVSLLVSYIYNLALPHAAIFFAIIGVCFFDWVLGSVLAFKRGKWESRRAVKVFVYVLVYSTLLLILAQIEEAFVTTVWIVEGVMMPIILIQLVSVLKNMNKLGLISNELLKQFLDKIEKNKDEED